MALKTKLYYTVYMIRNNHDYLSYSTSKTLCTFTTKVVRENVGFKQMINNMKKATNDPSMVITSNNNVILYIYIDLFCSAKRNHYNAIALTLILAMTRSLTFCALKSKFR